ncbi:MAG: dihydroorotate dehydrogenase [Dehalococcoidia bacterium]|jgi:dihydroorotate dehydrogenase (NAD+) catalytic subunit
MTLNLAVELAPSRKQGLPLRNPVMTASGTFSNGLEAARIFDIQRLGAIVSKGTTLRPRSGNPQPRTAETPSGMLNTIGLQNIGVEALVRDVAPVWAAWQVPVIVNIAGDTVDEFAELAARLDGVPGVSGIEVNVSCPNVAVGGMLFGQDPKQAAAVTRAVVRATTLPVIVKLTPNVTDVVSVALAVADAGADALCLINTVQAMAIDVRARRPVLSTVFGGLSGPAIKPLAVRIVYQVAAAVRIPIVGCGGIRSADDALEFIMAGATAVEVGTATFANPRAPLDVLEGIERFLQSAGVQHLAELVGVARLS